MELTATALPDELLVTVAEPRIDAACAIRFKDHMRQLMMHPARRVVLDLSHVTFLDSSGLGALVAVRKFLSDGRELHLSGLTANVRRVFRLTRMDTVFSLIETAPAGRADAG